MAANYFAAVRAFPRFFLVCEKVLHPLFFDEVQIIYHAHLIALFVPAVKSFQFVTWKNRALKTVSHFTIQQFGALLFNEGTLFVSRSAACAVGNFDAFAF